MNGEVSRARDAVLRFVCCASPASIEDLVAVVECRAGLCPRHGRTIIAALVGRRILERTADGRVARGPRFVAPAGSRETDPNCAASGVRGTP